jgi:hypothetical protein
MSRWKLICRFRMDIFVSSCGVKARYHFRRFATMEQGLSTLWLATNESWLAPNALSGLAPTLFSFTSPLPRLALSTSSPIPLQDPHHYELIDQHNFSSTTELGSASHQPQQSDSTVESENSNNLHSFQSAANPLCEMPFDSFNLFPLLPIEIRILIWIMTFPKGRRIGPWTWAPSSNPRSLHVTGSSPATTSRS